MSNLFRFKRFDVDQSNCAMKVNTDGAILGALASADQPKTILDIGTGTGVIALMLAQRFPGANIDAVEIDRAAAQTAEANFKNSTFKGRLRLDASSFEDFFNSHPDARYDLIVSNPPFYINSLASPGAEKKLAKHADVGFFEDLIRHSAAHLTKPGSLWLILPIDTAELVKGLAMDAELFLNEQINVLSYPDFAPHRQMLMFSLNSLKTVEKQFVIYNEPKRYSKQYEDALRDFFTIF
ncbi:tRNA1(Val) (adenine(37)-N6)-methyltransferase [Mucilaginibacter myungsuensis]|uniref:tRNA1(Val) (adenine(37)-N6)-methyltransferase n=1 Tax=Mucilaginibacter myungsuensis TaxID=649104 RepID=A0A929PUZ0_9SPHI|nr:methyltransferase [Mucilaginibacter myungsuensis]MBE9660441.1 methyltransferase [Mucilaginibacter myungsuensis]MDN3600483.1 methyltransferase [Mucilaginibacter myungsuensis]